MTRARWLRGLRLRIALLVTFAVAICAAVISVVAFESAAIYAHKDFEGDSAYRNSYTVRYVQTLLRTLPRRDAVLGAQTFVGNQYMSILSVAGSSPRCSTDGTTLCLDDLDPEVREVIAAKQDYFGYTRVATIHDTAFVQVSPLAVPGGGTAVLIQAFTFHDYATDLGRLKRHLVELNLGGLALALLVGLAVATGVRRPIRRVALAARRLGGGDLATRVQVRGGSELADLATSFNAMAERLSGTLTDLTESQTLQHRFVADVSHELRTPLSAMLAAGDGLDSADEHTRTRSTDLLRTQTRRLSHLVEELLEMSRFDSGQAVLRHEPVDLLELARDAVHTVAPQADIDVTGLGDTTAEVDAARLHAVVRNLVANAVHHGVPPVRVTVDGRADPLVVDVVDHGAGVAPELGDSVFERFVRADTARAGSGASSGLGLAIARENAHLHGATLTASASAPTTFTLRLPRHPAAPSAGTPPIDPTGG